MHHCTVAIIHQSNCKPTTLLKVPAVSMCQSYFIQQTPCSIRGGWNSLRTGRPPAADNADCVPSATHRRRRDHFSRRPLTRYYSSRRPSTEGHRAANTPLASAGPTWSGPDGRPAPRGTHLCHRRRAAVRSMAGRAACSAAGGRLETVRPRRRRRRNDTRADRAPSGRINRLAADRDIWGEVQKAVVPVERTGVASGLLRS